ncbi:WhiB family transcriptional regulator [Rhodococcoides fascians]|uniref:WhiB family transcriptional regulator n=1 Tax=Rhodococcoides fascians TaxID=1828 RepID=UPI0034D599D9
MRRLIDCDREATTFPDAAVGLSGWQAHARCRDYDPAAFFEPEEECDSFSETSISAKRICEGCVVRDDCLNYALDAGEQFGVWGGLTSRERKQYKWFHYRRDTSQLLGSASTPISSQ